MTATFLSYSIAGRSMEASQASINIVGNNISNVNTEGYTRQRVDVVSLTTSGMVQKYATPQVSTGIGAKAKGTTQLRDPYVDARFRTHYAETQRYETMVSGLTNLEDVLDEASTEALMGEISGFITDLQSFSTASTSSDIAQVVRASAEKVTQVINAYANQLNEVRVEQTENLAVVVGNEFNTYVQNIASLNKQIQREEIYGNTPNELYDQRNLLIDKLSGLANIHVSVTEDAISENLKVPHYTISIVAPGGKKEDGIVIVDNGKYSEMSMDTTDPEDVKLNLTDTTGTELKDIDSKVIDGSLRGYLNIINGKGSFANAMLEENDTKGINFYMERMNIFAQQFARTLNDVNNISGSTDFSSYALFNDGTTTGTADTIKAENIQVSAAWTNNPLFIKATSTPTETPSGVDNVLRMIEKMSDKIDFSDTASGFSESSTFSEYMTGVVVEVSTDTELYKNFSKTATNVFQTISDTRDSVSGVSLNEEGINLSAFQKIYSASIRFFNVIDENLDNIINTMGV